MMAGKAGPVEGRITRMGEAAVRRVLARAMRSGYLLANACNETPGDECTAPDACFLPP